MVAEFIKMEKENLIYFFPITENVLCLGMIITLKKKETLQITKPKKLKHQSHIVATISTKYAHLQSCS